MTSAQNKSSALATVVALLDASGFEYWLDFGALLGAVRDGDFIAWDGDLDFGVFADDVSLEALERVFAGHGTVTGATNARIYLDANPSVPIDIYRWSRRGDLAVATEQWHDRAGDASSVPWAGGSLVRMACGVAAALASAMAAMITPFMSEAAKDRWNAWLIGRELQVQYCFPSRHFIDRERMVFCGVSMPIPGEPRAYLAHCYGTDWETPAQWDNWWDGATRVNAIPAVFALPRIHWQRWRKSVLRARADEPAILREAK